MTRLIDADKVIQSIDMQMIIARELLGNYPQAQEFVNIAEQSIKQEISNAPTVDAVPVVRCKDCKYMTEHYDTDGNVPYWICSEWDSGTDYDGYCHYGERRKDETNRR